MAGITSPHVDARPDISVAMPLLVNASAVDLSTMCKAVRHAVADRRVFARGLCYKLLGEVDLDTGIAY